MKTHEEILERYKSNDSIDFFNMQRNILLSLRPFELAKPYLDANYVQGYNDLPEGEKWYENFRADEQILIFLPVVHKLISKDNPIETTKALLALKSLVWVADETFYNEIASFYEEMDLSNVDAFVNKVSKHFNYVPIIEDIEFEEIPKDDVQ
jgi:hypothetical protein